MLISLPYQHNRQAKNNNKFYSEKRKASQLCHIQY